MAKTNISFNDNIYSINTSSLSAAYDELSQHLSTTMSGSGTTINFDGTAYGVDSTKLSAAQSNFVSHLGTISGSGHKVVVGGVEYGVDSAKVSGAMTELEAALGGLQSEDGGNVPLKNKYGFYYNMPYVGKINGSDNAIIFYEEGTFHELGIMSLFDMTKSQPAAFSEMTAGSSIPFVYDEENKVITDAFGFGVAFSVSEDGMSLTGSAVSDGTFVVNGACPCHGIYYGRQYVSQNGHTIIFNEDNTALATYNGNSKHIDYVHWTTYNDGYLEGRYSFTSTLDGETLIVQDYYEDNQYIIYTCNYSTT